jgi:hypothetical protein
MRDLSNGRRIVLSTYFVEPADFVRWVDPGAYVTFLPGDNGNPTLDRLQSRLNNLEKAHVTMTMTGFTDDGYFGSDASEKGGSFNFVLRGRASAHSAATTGAGKGVIDCTSKKIESLVIDTL